LRDPTQKQAGGLAQDIGPEFKPQYAKKKKKKKERKKKERTKSSNYDHM
jgi:hypothetical protein